MDWSNILVGIAVVVGLVLFLVGVSLFLGGKKTLTDLGDRFWRWVFGVKKEQVPAPSPAPAQPPTPQLPDPVPDFTGHEEKVRQLVDRLRSRQGAAITAIGGQGGAGKTEMAYYVAKEVRDVYPGGQVQLDLRGLDAEPMTPEQAMTDVIVALEPGLKPPEEPSQIAGLYHGLLSERKVLILADNASDSEQVRPLAPKPPSALLVTSRQTIVVAGVERVDLEQLDPPDARMLLRGILKGKAASGKAASADDEDEIGRLAALCAFLPLALRVAGNRLAGSPALSVASYLDQLTKGSSALRFGGQDVMAVLTESVEALARDDKALAGKWRSLAVFPAPFGRPAAEVVGEFEDDELDRLLARSLVLYDAKEDRLRLHDLMRELLREGLGATDHFQAGKRHSRHYLEVIGRADDVYLRGEGAVLEGLRLFDRERVQIEAGQSWAAEHADSEDDAAAFAQDYPLRAPNMLDLRQHPRDSIGWLEASYQAARRLGNREDEGMVLGNLGNAYRQLGEPKRAIEYYEQVLAIARETGDRRSEGNALGNLGTAYLQLGEPKRAIEYYEQRSPIARETGDRRGEGNALWNRALAFDELGRRQEAISGAQTALAIFEQIEDPNAEMVRRKLADWGAAP